MPYADASATVMAEPFERPAPGIARGRWEAPAWAFYLVAAAVIVLGVASTAAALVRARRSRR